MMNANVENEAVDTFEVLLADVALPGAGAELLQQLLLEVDE